MLIDKFLRMNILNKKQYVLGFKPKNFRYTIDFMQPFAFLPQTVNNELCHTQRQEIILNNKIRDIKHSNVNLNINRKYLSSNTQNTVKNEAPELIIVHLEKGKYFK